MYSSAASSPKALVPWYQSALKCILLTLEVYDECAVYLTTDSNKGQISWKTVSILHIPSLTCILTLLDLIASCYALLLSGNAIMFVLNIKKTGLACDEKLNSQVLPRLQSLIYLYVNTNMSICSDEKITYCQ